MPEHVSVYYVNDSGPYCDACAADAVADTLIDQGFYWRPGSFAEEVVQEFVDALLDGGVSWSNLELQEIPHTDDGATECLGCETSFRELCSICSKEVLDVD